MSKKSEAIKLAIAAGNIALSDGSMDDPSDRHPWDIHIPRSYTIASFNDLDTAQAVFDILKSKARDDERERCAKIAENWLEVYGQTSPQVIDAQTWACDAVRDIADLIRHPETSH